MRIDASHISAEEIRRDERRFGDVEVMNAEPAQDSAGPSDADDVVPIPQAKIKDRDIIARSASGEFPFRFAEAYCNVVLPFSLLIARKLVDRPLCATGAALPEQVYYSLAFTGVQR